MWRLPPPLFLVRPRSPPLPFRLTPVTSVRVLVRQLQAVLLTPFLHNPNHVFHLRVTRVPQHLRIKHESKKARKAKVGVQCERVRFQCGISKPSFQSMNMSQVIGSSRKLNVYSYLQHVPQYLLRLHPRHHQLEHPHTRPPLPLPVLRIGVEALEDIESLWGRGIQECTETGDRGRRNDGEGERRPPTRSRGNMGVCQYEMECSGARPYYIRAFSLNRVEDSFLPLHSFTLAEWKKCPIL